MLTLEHAIGEFVPAGALLFDVEGSAERIDAEAVIRCVDFELERTAVQALDRLHDCLRQLVSRSFPDGRHRDDKGVVRLVTRVMSWDDYVHLAFDEIRLAGAGSPQVARRMHAALEDLLTIAPPDRKSALKQQLDSLQGSAREQQAQTGDQERSLRSDARGLG